MRKAKTDARTTAMRRPNADILKTLNAAGWFWKPSSSFSRPAKTIMLTAMISANAPMSKSRSTTQTASCEGMERPSFRAIRNGRMNSAARPRSANAVKPIAVGAIKRDELVSRTGRSIIFHRTARK